MYSLAGIIMDNINLDDKLAYEWMLKATEAADPLNKAFYGMGVLNEYGIGTPRNFVTALDWYKKAKENNVPDAEAKIKDLERKINSLEFNNYNNNINNYNNNYNNNINNNINNYNNNKQLSTPPCITTNFNNENVNCNQMDNTNNVSYNSEYYYSPIVMPSPAISVQSNPNDNNVIITKDQLKDMKLEINSDGKIVSIDKNNGNPSAQNNLNALDNPKRITSLAVVNDNNNFNTLSNPNRISSLASGNATNNKKSPAKSPLASYEPISNSSDPTSAEQFTQNDNINNNGYLDVSTDDSVLPVPKRLSSYNYSINDFDDIVNSFNEDNNENEDDNDDNEDDKILNMEEDINDTDVFDGLSYDPVQLNNDSTDIIEEKTSIKPRKSMKTYLPVYKARKSNNNPSNFFLILIYTINYNIYIILTDKYIFIYLYIKILFIYFYIYYILFIFFFFFFFFFI